MPEDILELVVKLILSLFQTLFTIKLNTDGQNCVIISFMYGFMLLSDKEESQRLLKYFLKDYKGLTT